MADKNKNYFNPKRLPADDFDRIIGGTVNIITLFRVECGKCGWISETLTSPPAKSYSCARCGEGTQGLIHYAYIQGEWIKIEA